MDYSHCYFPFNQFGKNLFCPSFDEFWCDCIGYTIKQNSALNRQNWIIGGGLAILYLLGYQKGKQKEQIKTMKGTLENVQKAKTIRDNVVDIDRIHRLHDKYKR